MWIRTIGAALLLAAASPLAMADDMIGKGPITIQAAPVEQSAVSVSTVVWLEKAEETTKLFSTVGGDPAINGEYLFLAVFPEDMSADVATFQIGDFNSWSVVEETKDHVKLKVSRSWVEDSSGDIKTAEETWTVPLPKSSAKDITVTIAK